MMLLETGDVAKAAGRTPALVRYWARTGLLPIAAQTPRGLRLFHAADVRRLIDRRERAQRRAAR